jgi:hypothetical protein
LGNACFGKVRRENEGEHETKPAVAGCWLVMSAIEVKLPDTFHLPEPVRVAMEKTVGLAVCLLASLLPGTAADSKPGSPEMPLWYHGPGLVAFAARDAKALLSIDGKTFPPGPPFRQGLESSADGTTSLVVWIQKESTSPIALRILSDRAVEGQQPPFGK